MSSATTVSMADATHTLTIGAAGANETQLVGNVVYVDAQSSGASENLILPAEADLAGRTLWIVVVGGEGVVVQSDAPATVITLATNEVGFVTSDGTTLRGGIAPTIAASGGAVVHPVELAKQRSMFGYWQASGASTSVQDVGVTDGKTTTQDSTASVGQDVNGRHFKQNTSTSLFNQAFTHSSLILRVDSLPYMVGPWAVSSAVDVDTAFAMVASASPQTILTPGPSNAHIGFVVYKSGGNNHTTIHVARDAAGGGSQTLVDTGVAVASFTHPTAVCCVIQYLTASSVLMELYACTDLSTALYSATFTTDIPLTGEDLGGINGVETQATSAKSIYNYRTEFSSSPGVL